MAVYPSWLFAMKYIIHEGIIGSTALHCCGISSNSSDAQFEGSVAVESRSVFAADSPDTNVLPGLSTTFPVPFHYRSEET